LAIKKLDEYAPRPLPKNVVDHLARKQLALVAKDLHPLNITEGTLRQQLFQEMFLPLRPVQKASFLNF